jgi:hypothetical protein
MSSSFRQFEVSKFSIRYVPSSIGPHLLINFPNHLLSPTNSETIPKRPLSDLGLTFPAVLRPRDKGLDEPAVSHL